MFSWNSSQRTRRPGGGDGGGGTATATYPGLRTQPQGTTTTATATTIQGSIRPPNSKSKAAPYTRKQHLDSYLGDDTLKRSTRRISSDDSTYDTVFQTVSGETLILRVHLPPARYPNDPVRAPIMTLFGVKARHEWLDQQMNVVGFGDIASDSVFQQRHVLLRDAVHTVVQKLQLGPPTIVEITDPNLRSIQQNSTGRRNASNNAAAATSASTPTRTQLHTANVGSAGAVRDRPATSSSSDAPPDYESLLSSQQNVDMPEIPADYAEHLESLDRDELEKLLNDELEFLSFVNSGKIPIVRKLREMSTTVMAENAEKATEHLKRQDELQGLHVEVKELHEALQKEVKEFQELEREQDEICAPPSRGDVTRDLSAASKRAFDESEQIAEDWLEGEGDAGVERFLESFLAKRRTHHTRAAKLELVEHGNLYPSR